MDHEDSASVEIDVCCISATLRGIPYALPNAVASATG